jgi:BlaI family transcriptional regulator, penicillinase repressor
MARRRSKTLTELELEIMQPIWEAGEPIGVEDIRARLKEQGNVYAPATIRTMLGILRDKRYVTRKKSGRGFLYQALVNREKAQSGIVADLLHRVFDGSAAALKAALLGSGKVTKKELDAIQRLLNRDEKEPKA